MQGETLDEEPVSHQRKFSKERKEKGGTDADCRSMGINPLDLKAAGESPSAAKRSKKRPAAHDNGAHGSLRA